LLDTKIDGALGVLFNITGGRNMTMLEIDEAAKVITEAVAPDANIIFGAVLDDAMEDDIQITVVATGFEPLRPAVSVPTRRIEPRPAAPVEEEEPEFIRGYRPLERPSLINEPVQTAPVKVEEAPVRPFASDALIQPRRYPSISEIEPTEVEIKPEETAVEEETPIEKEMDSLASRMADEESPMIGFEDGPVSDAARRPVKSFGDFGSEEDDLDVPAFIRKKVE